MLPPDIAQRLDRAMHGASPEAAVRRLVVSLKEEGVTQQEAHDYFLGAHSRLPGDVDAQTYDAIAEAIDGIVGAGSNPEYWIYGRRISDPE